MHRKVDIKRKRKPGSIEDARLVQWRALAAAEVVMFWMAKVGNGGGVLSAVHAITQASTAYAKLVEASELEARVAELEKLAEQRPGQPLRRVG